MHGGSSSVSLVAGIMEADLPVDEIEFLNLEFQTETSSRVAAEEHDLIRVILVVQEQSRSGLLPPVGVSVRELKVPPDHMMRWVKRVISFIVDPHNLCSLITLEGNDVRFVLGAVVNGLVGEVSAQPNIV